ncbi:AraC family transcriptional regulator [Anaerosporobacter faecicola]|uniref:AraC family transcriptional regulator n=1 Tax=Anaerosporobacter faecicola TaxID=2718714 RepID=UPI00143B186D|nr:AraC family transcriptional regulator [Anaerosporobacter faecicola]
MIEALHGIQETVLYHDMPGIKLFLNREQENYPPHWHTAMEIIMPYENSYTICIDQTLHTVEEGEIFLIAPGTIHQLLAPPSGARLILLLDYSIVCNVNGMAALLPSLRPFVQINKTEDQILLPTLQKKLNHIRTEYEQPSPFMEASINAYILQFFVALGRYEMKTVRRFLDVTPTKQHEYIETFMKVCTYITEHCAENISVDDLAEFAGFSKFHFIRLFKQFTNVTCYEYLVQKRIELAERLLIEPELSITEIAMRSGFGSLSSFNRVFKTAKNCTPSEYKKLNTSHKSL